MMTWIIALIIILLIASLVVSAVTYSRQQAAKAKQQQLARLKQRQDETLAHIRLLLQIDGDYDILIFLQKQLITFIKSGLVISPDEIEWQKNLTLHTQNLIQYQAGKRPQAVHCYADSDSELGTMQMQLAQLGKALDIARNRGHLSVSQRDQFEQHLRRLKLDLDVNSHIHQADKCATEGDVVMYQLHLKEAREALNKSNIDYPDKLTRIKELTEKLDYSKRTNRIFGSDVAAPADHDAPVDTNEENTGEQATSE